MAVSTACRKAWTESSSSSSARTGACCANAGGTNSARQRKSLANIAIVQEFPGRLEPVPIRLRCDELRQTAQDEDGEVILQALIAAVTLNGVEHGLAEVGCSRLLVRPRI